MSRFTVFALGRGLAVPTRKTVGLAALLVAVMATPQSATAQQPAVKYVAADVAFVQGMIAHHAQALLMTALMPASTRDQTLRLLGERITVSQRDEIAMMAEWLRVRGEAVPAVAAAVAAGSPLPTGMDHGSMDHASMSAGDHLMPGMLSASQMDTLRSARGAAFDHLFLRYMIQHHEGALAMVMQLMSSPGAAQEPQLFGFASDVDTDQRAEIRRMQTLLTKRPRPAAPAPL